MVNLPTFGKPRSIVWVIWPKSSWYLEAVVFVRFVRCRETIEFFSTSYVNHPRFKNACIPRILFTRPETRGNLLHHEFSNCSLGDQHAFICKQNYEHREIMSCTGRGSVFLKLVIIIVSRTRFFLAYVGLECDGHSFDYVAHFVFLRDSNPESWRVASRRATNNSHLSQPTKTPISGLYLRRRGTIPRLWLHRVNYPPLLHINTHTSADAQTDPDNDHLDLCLKADWQLSFSGGLHFAIRWNTWGKHRGGE